MPQHYRVAGLNGCRLELSRAEANNANVLFEALESGGFTLGPKSNHHRNRLVDPRSGRGSVIESWSQIILLGDRIVASAEVGIDTSEDKHHHVGAIVLASDLVGASDRDEITESITQIIESVFSLPKASEPSSPASPNPVMQCPNCSTPLILQEKALRLAGMRMYDCPTCPKGQNLFWWNDGQLIAMTTKEP
jgi:hypothetical protein